jgi:hypothetical protein
LLGTEANFDEEIASTRISGLAESTALVLEKVAEPIPVHGRQTVVYIMPSR